MGFHGIQQLLHVLISAQAFHGLVFVQLAQYARVLRYTACHRIGILVLHHHLERANQDREVRKQGLRSPVKFKSLWVGHHLPYRHIIISGSHHHTLHSRFTYSPLGVVYYPFKSLLIGCVHHKAQVAH